MRVNYGFHYPLRALPSGVERADEIVGTKGVSVVVAGPDDLRQSHLAIGSDSALYVAQATVPAVTVFTLDGQVLRRIGRAGRGPGDFEFLARGVGWIGDTLWVADPNRMQLFTADERVPEQVIQFSTGVPEEGSRLTPGRMLADGTLIGRRRIAYGRALSSRGENPGLALRRLSRSGEVLDTIATIEWPGNAVEHERDARLFPGQRHRRADALDRGADLRSGGSYPRMKTYIVIWAVDPGFIAVHKSIPMVLGGTVLDRAYRDWLFRLLQRQGVATHSILILLLAGRDGGADDWCVGVTAQYGIQLCGNGLIVRLTHQCPERFDAVVKRKDRGIPPGADDRCVG